MPRRTQQQKRKDGHMPTFERYERGRNTFSRPIWGYKVECECGWSKSANYNMEEATSWHNDHLNRDVT